MVLEAFGIVAEPNGEIDATLWRLENKGPYDILTRRDEAGRVVKRVHVYACDYRVLQDRVFRPAGQGRRGRPTGRLRVGREGFHVPTRINVVSTAPDGRKDSMEIDLSGPRPTKFSDRQRQKLLRSAGCRQIRERLPI